MTNYNLVTITRQQLRDELEFKMFPRKPITFKHEKGFDYIVKQGFEKYLNKYVFNPRLYVGQVVGNAVDIGSVTVGLGVKIGAVTGIIPASYFSQEDFMSLWLRSFLFGNSGVTLLGNIYKFNQEFHQFVIAKEVYNQIKRKYFNKNTDWTVIEGKIIVGRTFVDVDKICIFFLPHFVHSAESWEIEDSEYQFLLDCMYGELLKKEALSQSESKIMGIETNMEDMLNEGKEILQGTVEEWNKITVILSGRRI